jgi:hypothetical protein
MTPRFDGDKAGNAVSQPLAGVRDPERFWCKLEQFGWIAIMAWNDGS